MYAPLRHRRERLRGLGGAAVGNYRLGLGFTPFAFSTPPSTAPTAVSTPAAASTPPFAGYELAEAGFCALTAWTIGKMQAQAALNNARPGTTARRAAQAAVDAYGSAPAPGSFNVAADQVCRDVGWRAVQEVGDRAQLCDDAIAIAASGAQIASAAGRTGAQRLRQALKERNGCKGRDTARAVAAAAPEFAAAEPLAAGAFWYGTGRPVEAKIIADEGFARFYAAKGAATGVPAAELMIAFRELPRPVTAASRAQVDNAVLAKRMAVSASSFAAAHPSGAGACWEVGFKPAATFAPGSAQAVVADRCASTFQNFHALRQGMLPWVPGYDRFAELMAAQPAPPELAMNHIAAAQAEIDAAATAAAAQDRVARAQANRDRIGTALRSVRIRLPGSPQAAAEQTAALEAEQTAADAEVAQAQVQADAAAADLARVTDTGGNGKSPIGMILLAAGAVAVLLLRRRS